MSAEAEDLTATCPDCGGTVVATVGQWGVYGGCGDCWTAYHRPTVERFVEAVERRENCRVVDDA